MKRKTKRQRRWEEPAEEQTGEIRLRLPHGGVLHLMIVSTEREDDPTT